MDKRGKSFSSCRIGSPLCIVPLTSNGTPTFALNTVEVTDDEKENGIHYYLAEAELLQARYEEPFVHFDQEEAPAFLHPAVRQHLALQRRQTAPHPKEAVACPA